MLGRSPVYAIQADAHYPKDPPPSHRVIVSPWQLGLKSNRPTRRSSCPRGTDRARGESPLRRLALCSLAEAPTHGCPQESTIASSP
ncbi:unnamed protein product [Protopolystoma xenopodis]|uniref:Uncharacterized protein n=1 Tax=Protopolystoma xenopodis TaxID=117903 RepID=A0A3S5AEK4_9PLAT|nr:unnamed protein product [Protopolystoma xenopodis]